VAHEYDVIPLKWRLSWRSPIEKADKAALEYGVRNATAVVVQTTAQGRLLKENYRRDFTALVRNFHPIPKGVPAKVTNRVRVCWVANVRPWKQPEVFVQLAESFADRDDVEFIMAGSPCPGWDQWARLEQRMSSLRNFTYLGAQSQESIDSLLASSHLLVNTSLREGFSNVFIEAWAREVPVIGFAVDADGLFSAEGIGVYAAGDFALLRAAVSRLVTDGEARASMGSRARKFAATHFSMHNVSTLTAILDPDSGKQDDARPEADALARTPSF
jgi:glycosyltransferase involved in cell wall biosynthesis